ncbi:MAG: VWA domain-containing protein [Nitrospinae bacterium]|nr:VWA domain-containing protein [Nitrospinota bacterium]
MRFHSPEWWWAAAALPLALGLSLWGVKRGFEAMGRFVSPEMLARLAPQKVLGAKKARAGFLIIACALLIVALARPQYGVKPVQITRSGIDMVIALDVSKSMAARDIKPSRIERAKLEISRLASALEGNRMGLIAFAGKSFVECPLTTDTAALKMFLDSLDTSSIPVPGTAVGAAVHGAVEALAKSKAKTRAAIIVTDGEDLEGGVDEAISEAAKAGVKVFTVGIGSQTGAPVPEVDSEGNVTGYKTGDGGATVISRLDSRTLRSIADSTDGAFYATEGDSLDMDPLIKALKSMDKTDITSQEFTEYEERYQPFALAALLMLVADYLVFYRLSLRERAVSTRSAV